MHNNTSDIKEKAGHIYIHIYVYIDRYTIKKNPTHLIADVVVRLSDGAISGISFHFLEEEKILALWSAYVAYRGGLTSAS